LQYLGEEGDACQLKAAVICASPWNLEISSVAMQSTYMGLEVYSKVMGSSMKKLFEQYATPLHKLSVCHLILCRHADEVIKNPQVNAEQVRNITYLHEFDRSV
jgi:predicted alpha/beta-fold hydrolase